MTPRALAPLLSRRRKARDGATVLVTGAAGCIGEVLRRELAQRHGLRLLDARPSSSAGSHRGDMRRLDDVAWAFDGIETVIDLAANSDQHASWEQVRRNNLEACANTLEAARRAGVRRVIVASSNHVTGLYERDDPYAVIVAGKYGELDSGTLRRIDRTWPIRPDGFYGVGKAMAEAAGRYYADEHGLSVICLRIGTVNRANRPTSPRTFATLLTHRDLAQLVEQCLTAPTSLRYAIYYGFSANTWRFWDIGDARAEIGYEPRDDAEEWRGPTSG